MGAITAMAVSTAVSLGTSIAGAAASAKQAREGRRKQREAQRQIAAIEAGRQEVPDITASVRDLSAMITNPFQNLQVATGAAEMQAEQTDIALAQTLDQLRTTGAGAGGATALAQAALQSRQGIAASIQQQEAQNARLRAQGAQQMQEMQMREATRLQQAEVAGAEFQFQAQEKRDIARLNRLAGLQQQGMVTEQAGRAGVASALGTGASQIAGIASSYLQSQNTVGGKVREGTTASDTTANQFDMFGNYKPKPLMVPKPTFP
jgi:hypothetical protein